MTTEQAIRNLLERLRTDIIRDQEEKNIKASGESAKSLRSVANKEEGQLLGFGYFNFQQFGRRPGKFPPIQAIRDWVDAKGIEPQDITKDSLAFLIARKIANEGTKIYKNESPALAVSDLIQINVARSKPELIKAQKDFLKSRIFEQIKTSLA